MKYCFEIVESICKDIENGLPQYRAAILNGICKETFYEWKRSKPDFSDCIEKALTVFMKKHVQRINNASDKSWQASAWTLERRFRDDYAINHNLDITTKGEPIQIIFKEVESNK